MLKENAHEVFVEMPKKKCMLAQVKKSCAIFGSLMGEEGIDDDNKATIIDGKAIAQTICSEIASKVDTFIEKYGKAPGLVMVILDHRKDSQVQMEKKKKTRKSLRK